MKKSEKGGVPKQEDLDQKDVNALFERIAEHFKDESDESREIFSMLVTETVRYRDMLVHSTGEALTVGEAREALGAFMEVMRTHSIPEDLGGRVHDLVILWLERIREMKQH